MGAGFIERTSPIIEPPPPARRTASRADALAILALVVGAAATAINPVFVRLSELAPTASAFQRMAWALPVLWLWARLERGRPFTPGVPGAPGASGLAPRDRWLLALCGLFFAADLAALHGSIRLTAVANAILFLNAQPIYVVLALWLFFGARFRRKFLFGLAAALAGLVVMMSESARFGTGRLLGDVLGVAAGICYAGFILTASRLRTRVSSAVVNLWTCLVGAPLLLLAALAAGQDVIPHSLRGWTLMIALGVISQAFGQGLIVWALAHLAAGYSAVALLSAPIAAAFFAWAFLGESMTFTQLVGVVVMMGGIQAALRARP